jgi:TatD DNase family protein
MYWDVHCHLTDSRWGEDLPAVLSEAHEKGISGFFLGGYEPREWLEQLELMKAYPNYAIEPCFGLHPMWVSQTDEAHLESGLDQLARLLPLTKAIGEIGLDARSQYLNGWGLQMEAFRSQLELAGLTRKPIVLHLVHCHQEALRVLSLHREWVQGGFVHAFSGDRLVAKQYLDYSLALSIGGAISRPQAHELREVVRWLPKESLLLETDSPDQKIKNWPSSLHRPVALWNIAEIVAEIRGERAESVLQQSTENLRRILRM